VKRIYKMVFAEYINLLPPLLFYTRPTGNVLFTIITVLTNGMRLSLILLLI
jgi:hypothetical protein